jgi:hypothetical protein
MEVDRRFRGEYCLHHQGNEYAQMLEAVRALMIEAVRTSETSAYFHELHAAILQKAVIYIHAAVRT